MASNPFDQFDEGNPFDQFDAPAGPPSVPQQLGRAAAMQFGRAPVEAATAMPGFVMDRLFDTLSTRTGVPREKFSAFDGGAFQRNVVDRIFPQPETKTEKAINLAQNIALGGKLPMGSQSIGRPAPQNFKPSPLPMTPAEETLAAGQGAGYSVPPSTVKPTWWRTVAESFGGKAATQQAASLKNQSVTDKLVRQELGLADDAPLTPEVMRGVRARADQAAAPIRATGRVATDETLATDLAAVSQHTRGAERMGVAHAGGGHFGPPPPTEIAERIAAQKDFDAADALDTIRYIRDLTDDAYRTGQSTAARGYKAVAKALENQIERHMERLGENGKEMLDAYRKARTLQAKSYTVEKALNPATGRVNAAVIGREFARKPEKLTGGLRTIGAMAKAFPKATEEIRHSGPVSALDAALTAMAGGYALGSDNPKLAPLALAWPGLRIGARYGLLSRPVQAGLLPRAPAYGPVRPELLYGPTVGLLASQQP